MSVKRDCNPEAVKHKTLQVKFTQAAKAEDDEYYHFEGYGAVFGNIDSYGDIIMKGAFAESLETIKPKLCYQHWMSNVIGVIDEAKEDDRGLFIKCRIPKAHTVGSDVATLIKCGGLDEMSIGYSEIDVSAGKFEGKDVHFLEKLKLYEISVVSHAANKEAVITGFKSMESAESIRDVEVSLREMGLSAKQAKTIISKVKEISERDVTEEKKDVIEETPEGARDAVSEEEVLQKLDEAIQNRKLLNYLN